MPSNNLFAPSRLAAASLGFGVGGLLGVLAALISGSALGASAMSSSWGLSGGIAFWAGAAMCPVALVTGVVAKIRVRPPGWWSTVGIILGAVTLVIVVGTLVLVFAMTQEPLS